MYLLSNFLIGSVATWLLTWSMITLDTEGPFRLYDHIRAFIGRNFPPFVAENKTCPICVSWWAAVLVAACLPVYGGLNWLQCALFYFVLVYAFSGVTVFWYRYIKAIYGVSSDTF